MADASGRAGGDAETEDWCVVGGAFCEAEDGIDGSGAGAEGAVESGEWELEVDDVVVGGGDAVVGEEGGDGEVRPDGGGGVVDDEEGGVGGEAEPGLVREREERGGEFGEGVDVGDGGLEAHGGGGELHVATRARERSREGREVQGFRGTCEKCTEKATDLTIAGPAIS